MYNSPMKDQVMSLNELIQQQFADLEPKARYVLTTPEIFNIQKIILTGAGDSYAAALIGKYYIEKFSGIQAEVVSIMDLARNYRKETLYFSPQNPLVIGISNSGKVARLAEAMERTKAWGAHNLAITSAPESPVGLQADKHLLTEIPSMPSSPGVRSYLVSGMAVALLAIRLGEVRGYITQDQAIGYRNEIQSLAVDLGNIEQVVDQITPEWSDFEGYDFIGDGPDFGNVLYGSAKILEAAGKYSMYVNTEEWLHLNFFLRKNTVTGTVLFINKENAGYSREAEVLDYMQQLGRPSLVITDTDLKVNDQVTVIKVTGGTFSPLLQWIPTALLASNIAAAIGEEDGRGTKGPWSFAENGAAVQKSDIKIIE